jgi:L-2-hydroxyglutarate oxidase LhgO
MPFNIMQSNQGRAVVVASQYNVVNGAGSGSSPVSVNVTGFQDMYGTGLLPQNGSYAVAVTPSQACAVSVSNKSTTGFTVTLTPPSSGTIAAGTFDIVVHS